MYFFSGELNDCVKFENDDVGDGHEIVEEFKIEGSPGISAILDTVQSSIVCLK